MAHPARIFALNRAHGVRAFAVLLALIAFPVVAAQGEPDRVLAQSLLDISQSRVSEAIQQIDRLTTSHPNFRLAQLIKGDLLLARVQPLSTLGNTRATGELDQLREEARQRVRSLTDEVPDGKVPANLLSLASEYRHALVVDASRSRLYVFANTVNGPQRVADFYVTIGKAGIGKQREGDNRTPIGIYTITGFKSRGELGDFYGSGAFTLSYPNEWDSRQGRNGHGIWIHGSPSNTYSRTPKASEGCVVLSNTDLTNLGRYILRGKTPVVIAREIEWVTPQQSAARRAELTSAIESWRRDWESRDTDRLMRHYAQSFRAETSDYREFAETKRRVNAGKSWIKVELDSLSLLLYPEKGMAQVSFIQNYQSNNLADRTPKRQLWTRDSGRWQILNETQL